MRTKLVIYVTYIVVMGISFVITSVISKELFVSNTPQIKPQLYRYIARRFTEIKEGNTSNLIGYYFPQIDRFISNVSDKETEQQMETYLQQVASEPLKQIAPGVYARENENILETVIDHNNIEWVEYTYTIKGETVKIKVRPGQKPPRKERVPFD